MAALFDFLKNWWAWMSCALWTFLGFGVLALNPTAKTQMHLYFAAAILSLILALVQTLYSERKRRIAAEKMLDTQRPRIALIPTKFGSGRWFYLPFISGESVFSVVWLSGDPAQHIQVLPIPHPKHRMNLVFKQVDYLSREHPKECLAYSVHIDARSDDLEWGNQEILRCIFLRDDGAEYEHTVDYRAAISFFWKDVRLEEECILRWDPNASILEVLSMPQ